MGRRKKRNSKGIPTILPAKEIGVSDLTVRQIEVLSLIAAGHGNKEIAEILSVMPGTIKAHIAKLMNIFGLHTRTELAVLWLETVHKMGNKNQGSETQRQVG
ncbi:MAG: helix-turn-helix transcriptional regulator [Chloroflexia bacterium]